MKAPAKWLRRWAANSTPRNHSVRGKPPPREKQRQHVHLASPSVASAKEGNCRW